MIRFNTVSDSTGRSRTANAKRRAPGLSEMIPRGIAICLFGACLVAATGCGSRTGGSTSAKSTSLDGQHERLKIGVAFETLQTEYWVASLEHLRRALANRHADVIEVVADGDANRQLEQVQSLVERQVDGIILVPKDAQTCVPMIRAANKSHVPIVLYNRGAAEGSGPHVTVVADNRAITRATVEAMIHLARARGRRLKAAVLIGDLGDINAVERRAGFDEAVAAHPEVIEVVAQVPTEWNQEKALAGITNALQAHADIEFIFTSSDFMFPSIVSALKAVGHYLPVSDPRHVILGGFDGDATAHALLSAGYLDADGVQDVAYECEQAVDAIYRLHRQETVPPVVSDPGFVIHQGNLATEGKRMWGATVRANP